MIRGDSAVRRCKGPSLLVIALAIALSGCSAGIAANQSQGGGTEAALGEELKMDFPAHDAFVLAQDTLHGEGVLFAVKPQESLVTIWQTADNPPGFFASLVGVQPRYRYEIQAVPDGPTNSRIIVNVRTEDIPDSDLARYKATARLDLFNKIKHLAELTPPPSTIPRTGGVNFALLPNEDLRGLARRVTGREENWNQIAKDNGISSAGDLTPLQTIWVRNSLLKGAPARPSLGGSSDQ
jgi:hypothetical protein